MSETDPIIDLEERLFEEMGDPKATSRENKAIMRKLLYVFVLVTFFTAIKIAGGILSGSIAIIADAAHMFTDFIALLIAIVSVWISSFKANRAHSYGFHRAGVIGALASVIVLWVLIGFLVYYGIMRIINHEQIVIRGEIMFGVACVGLIINLIMINILHHTKKNSYPHYPSKSSQVIAEAQESVGPCDNVAESFYTGSAQEVVHSDKSKIPRPESPSEEQIEYIKRNLEAAPLEAAVNPYENEVQERTGFNKELAKKKAAAKRARNLSIVEARDNINVRATVIHILGDILQSVTVIIVSILIWAFPEDTRIADPITTLVFAFIIFVSSMKILKDCLFVLMESTPDGFVLEDFEKEMMEIEGVEEIHDLHVWTLGVGKHSMSAHLYASKNEGYVLNRVTALCRSHGIYHTTVQIETQRDQEHEDYLDCKHNLH